MKDQLIREARRLEEDSLYSSKGHWEAAAWWSRVHLGLGLLATVLAGTAGAAALGDYAQWAGGLALAGAAVTGIMTFLNPDQRAMLHQTAGNRFNSIKNRTRFFREIDIDLGRSEQELVEQLRQLRCEYERVRGDSPLIPRWAYCLAKQGIARGEATYDVDSDAMADK